MAKRKYTRIGETATHYQRSKIKCQWWGTMDQKSEIQTDPDYKIYKRVCPNCGNDTFYGLIEMPLPPLNVVVKAKCRRVDGTVEPHLIRRIKANDVVTGWQWSHHIANSYFTLKVLSWENINRLTVSNGT